MINITKLNAIWTMAQGRKLGMAEYYYLWTVNHLETILSQYEADGRVARIKALVSGDRIGRYNWTMPWGGQLAFLLAAFFSKMRKARWFLWPTIKRRLLYMQKTPWLRYWIPNVFNFFSRFFQAAHEVWRDRQPQHGAAHRDCKQDYGSGAQPGCDNLSRSGIWKVVDPSVLEKSRIKIKREWKIWCRYHHWGIMEYGFEKVILYTSRFLSIRGQHCGYLSFGNEWPYRIDLYDDEVESIRFWSFYPIVDRKIEGGRDHSQHQK